MDVFKPPKRAYVPRKKAPATLAVSDNPEDPAPTQPDAEVVEMQGEDGWLQWQDSVFVQEYSDEALQTVPGTLKDS